MAVADVYGFNDDLIQAVGLRKRKQSKEAGVDRSRLYCLQHKDAYTERDSQFFAELLRAVTPDPSLFKAKQPPSDFDWMSFHNEAGQSFAEFLRIPKNVPALPRKKIYLLPLVFFEDPVPNEILRLLKTYASLFFGMPVKVLKKVNLKSAIPYRDNYFSGTLQVDAGAILKKLESLLPADAFCLAGISMCDMYPRASWNFVFGLANLIKRCGVYSLARYLPTFGEERTSQVRVDREGLTQLLMRSCKVMCHEMCHMFGMKHCVYFECLMNGSNHLKEADERPLYLCPTCLRKLHHSCRFDIQERYTDLAHFTAKHNMDRDHDWFRRRLKQLSGEKGHENED